MLNTRVPIKYLQYKVQYSAIGFFKAKYLPLLPLHRLRLKLAKVITGDLEDLSF